MEIAFVVLLAIIVQLYHHLSNLRVELNAAEEDNTCSVTLHWLSLISAFSHNVVKSAHPLLLHSNSVFKLNGKYSRSSMGARAPRGASKATKCDGNEGAVGNWFLLRG